MRTIVVALAEGGGAYKAAVPGVQLFMDMHMFAHARAAAVEQLRRGRRVQSDRHLYLYDC